MRSRAMQPFDSLTPTEQARVTAFARRIALTAWQAYCWLSLYDTTKDSQ